MLFTSSCRTYRGSLCKQYVSISTNAPLGSWNKVVFSNVWGPSCPFIQLRPRGCAQESFPAFHITQFILHFMALVCFHPDWNQDLNLWFWFSCWIWCCVPSHHFLTRCCCVHNTFLYVGQSGCHLEPPGSLLTWHRTSAWTQTQPVGAPQLWVLLLLSFKSSLNSFLFGKFQVCALPWLWVSGKASVYPRRGAHPSAVTLPLPSVQGSFNLAFPRSIRKPRTFSFVSCIACSNYFLSKYNIEQGWNYEISLFGIKLF